MVTIKGKTIYVWLLAICMTNFFGFYKLLPMGKSLYSVDYMFVCIFLVAVYTFLLRLALNHMKVNMGIKNKGLCISLIILILIEIVYTYVQYHQPISQAIKEGMYYIIPLFCYFTYMQFPKSEGAENEIYNVIVKVSLIASAVAVIAFILYTYCDINFLQLTDSSSDKFRNGTIRFGVGTIFVYIGLIISLSKVLHMTYTKVDLINILLSILQILFVNKTRTIILYFVIIALFAIISEKRVKPFLKIVIYAVIFANIIVIFIYSNQLSLEIPSYLDNDAGIAIRFKTIEFYMNQFFQNPILGMGLLSSSKDISGWQLRFGNAGYFYRDDVGIIGLVNALGICGLAWTSSFLIIVNKMRKKMNNLNNSIVKNFLFYLVMTMINLCFMDSQRLMYLFWILIIVEECDDSLINRQNILKGRESMKISHE